MATYMLKAIQQQVAAAMYRDIEDAARDLQDKRARITQFVRECTGIPLEEEFDFEPASGQVTVVERSSVPDGKGAQGG